MARSNQPALDGARAFELKIGHLATDQMVVFERFRSQFDLDRASVVEVGGCIPQEHVAAAGARAWWSIDPANSATASRDLVHTMRGVASSIPLPENSADYVFSCNAFQHISDVPESLLEISRVLRPGGLLYANFGPVWSAPDGSHIEALMFENRRYDFWTHTLLPPWSHLIFDESELRELLRSVHDAGFADAITHYVFHSTWINRVNLTQFVRGFHSSPLEVEFLGGTSEFDYDYDFQPSAIDHPLFERLQAERLLEEVQRRYQLDESSMRIRDVEVILRKA